MISDGKKRVEKMEASNSVKYSRKFKENSGGGEKAHLLCK